MLTLPEMVALRNTLERIEVHGKRNLTDLANCIAQVEAGIAREREKQEADENGKE